MKHLPVFARIWLLSFAVCIALVAFSFAHLDVPLALHFWKVGRFLRPLDRAFGAAGILSFEAAVALGLILTRVVRGHISPLGEAAALACLASICTYGINSEVLKPFFGVPAPAAVMEGAAHSFNFLAGPANSSFPSGHMVLAAAFAGVFMKLYRGSVGSLSVLLLLGAGLLLMGGWHFLSDVIAGAFAGLSAGLLAGEAWIVHKRPP
ncbi:MAG TPA: phosphatase PAP2 family protein [Steroidobacteraceae bacterium]|nr:phosphatase PAP2 family protein [Steroidobacteraceae bacterium]